MPLTATEYLETIDLDITVFAPKKKQFINTLSYLTEEDTKKCHISRSKNWTKYPTFNTDFTPYNKAKCAPVLLISYDPEDETSEVSSIARKHLVKYHPWVVEERKDDYRLSGKNGEEMNTFVFKEILSFIKGIN